MAFNNRSIRGWLKYIVFLLLCFSVYACTGSYNELQMLYAVFDLALPDACFLLPGEYSLLLDLDEYVPLSEANCRDVGAPLHQLMGSGIIADSATLDAVRLQARIAAINSGVPVLACLLLAIDLCVRGRLSDRVVLVIRGFRIVLYGTLFAVAVYRGMVGDFPDIWASALWLFALIFIELNVFQWRRKT